MKCFKTYVSGLYVLFGVLLMASCSKEVPTVNSSSLDLADNALVREWYDLSLQLIPKCNGYSEPIAARSLTYVSYAMYESLIHGLPSYNSLQLRADGLKTTLPQADPQKEYNWAIVANEATAFVVYNMYLPSGNNILKVDELKNNFNLKYSSGLTTEVVSNSVELGKSIGRAIYKYSLTDGQNEAFLYNYPDDYVLTSGPGQWIPSSPDYEPKPMLPYWGTVRPTINDNLKIALSKDLQYSTSPNSTIYAEALEVYNLSQNLTNDQKESLEYWNRYMDSHATALCHNLLLSLQLVKEQQLDLPKTLELMVRMSFAMHDAYVATWNVKYKMNLLRVSTYIKQNISRFYIPEMASMPVPEFVSESAVIYSLSSEILAATFGHRFPYMDYTQKDRKDLRSKQRYFESFEQMSKEAAYSDIYAGVHFRSSIDAGYDLGFDIAQQLIKFPLTSK